MSEDGGGGGGKGEGGGGDYGGFPSASSAPQIDQVGTGAGAGSIADFNGMQFYVPGSSSGAASVDSGGSSNDYSTIAPNDFSNLDYLVPEGSPAGTFAPEQAFINSNMVPGYGATDLGGLQPSGSGTPPNSFFDAGLPSGAGPTSANATGMPDSIAGLVTPSADIPNAMLPVTGENGQPAGGWPTAKDVGWQSPFAAVENTFGGPAGASASPDFAALRAAPIGGGEPSLANTGPVGATGGAGPSASGGGLQGAGGGIAANDLSRDRPKKEGDTGFLSNFGISNPLGTGLAAGALGYSMLRNNATANASQTGTGQIPAANMAAIAAPLIAQGRNMTGAGLDVVGTGITDARNRAADLPATTQAGRDALTNSITALNTTAAALPGQVAPGQAIQAQTARDLQAAAAALPQTAAAGQRVVQDSAASLTQLAADTTPTAQRLIAQGTDLTRYIGTGTLPPEMMAQVDAQVQADKAKLISGYAARGMPTNPARNSSLRMELEAMDRQRLITINSMATQLGTTGTNIVNAGGNLNQQSGGFSTSAGNLGATYGNLVNATAVNSGNLTRSAGDVGTSMVSGANAVANTQGTLEQAAGTAGGSLATANRADQVAAGSLEQQAAGLGQGLITSGLAASGMSANTYNQLAQLDQQQADRTQKAIAAMAAALNSGTPARTPAAPTVP